MQNQNQKKKETRDESTAIAPGLESRLSRLYVDSSPQASTFFRIYQKGFCYKTKCWLKNDFMMALEWLFR